MTTAHLSRQSYAEQPEMIAILLCCLLYKLGGQITMSLMEVHNIFAEFPEIRLALKRVDETGMEVKPEFQTLTVTLRSKQMVDEGRL